MKITKISYDEETDAMYIYLTSSKKKITDTKEVSPGIIADYVGKELVGIEILDASKVLGSKLGLKADHPRNTVAISHSIHLKSKK